MGMAAAGRRMRQAKGEDGGTAGGHCGCGCGYGVRGRKRWGRWDTAMSDCGVRIVSSLRLY